MKKARGKKKIGRPSGRKPLLALRIDQRVYDQLQNAASKSGVTLAAEATTRLDRTLLEDIDAGGPEMRRLGKMMEVVFLIKGTQNAAQFGLALDPNKWLRDQDCFRGAMIAVIAALIQGMPENPSVAEKDLIVEAVNSSFEFAQRISRSKLFNYLGASGGEEK